MQKKITVSILFFSILFPIFVYLSVGIYYDEFEAIANSFLSFEYSSVMDYSWAPNVWVLIAPILSKLSFLYGFSFLSLANLLLVMLNLFLSLYLTSRFFKEKNDLKKMLLILLILSFVLLPLIYFISNRSLVIWLCFNATFLWYINLRQYNQVSNHLYALLLICLALFIRFDLVLLFSVHLFIYAWIFNKGLIKASICLFILSSTFFLLFELSSFYFFNEYYYIERAERILMDKGFVGNALLQNDFKNIAISLYLNDSEVFNDTVYKSVVNEFSMFKYVFSKQIMYATLTNARDFIAELNRFKFHLILFILLPIYFKDIFKTNTKYLLFIVIQLAILLFMLPFLKIPGIYWFSISSILLIIFLLKHSAAVFKNKYLILVVLILISALFLFQNIPNQKKYSREVNTYRDLMKEFEINNINIVFSFYPQGFQNLSKEIFFNSTQPKIKHYYLDAFFFSKYAFVKDEHNAFFNNKYEFLIEKLKVCEEREVAFFIDEGYRGLLANYLKDYHNTTLEYEEFDFINYAYLEQNNIHSKPYKIKIKR